MIEHFRKQIEGVDSKFVGLDKADFKLPIYEPKTHYVTVAESKYFQALVELRHFIKAASDIYWGQLQGAYNVDLFMMTPSVSSPMGPGSDSEAIPIKFGNQRTYLTDSSQFGFEPILVNGISRAYCYLPSMRGEDPDKRHLNQFYHCEAEVVGSLDQLKPLIQGYVGFLAETLLSMKNILNLLSIDYDITIQKLSSLTDVTQYDEISLEDVVKILRDNGLDDCVFKTLHGKDVSNAGEIKVAEILKIKRPFWITNYDRDRVAFYQKPCRRDPNKVINADLIFPRIIEVSFGGEIVGAGERQDNKDDIYESLRRQGLDSGPYEWYINLRGLKNYHTTSGFGLGIERFIAWVLNMDDIKNTILYPRLKNIMTYP